MKKLLLVVLLAAVAGALVWFFAFGGKDKLGGGGGTTPHIGQAFDADQTVVLAAAQGLDGLASETAKLLGALPPDSRSALPPEITDPKAREQKLGFDPLKAEGWRSIGVDPQAGVGFGLDTRFAQFQESQPTPIFAVAVTDREKLLPALNKMGIPVTASADPQLGEIVTIHGERFLSGKRAGLTMLVPAPESLAPDKLKALHDAFAAYLKGEGKGLSKSDAFRDAFDDIGGTPAYAFYGASAPAVAMYQAAEKPDAKTLAIAKFYTERFPALGLTIGPGGGGVRVLANQDGVKGLRQVFVPRKSAPAFSKYVPRKGSIGLRFSVNLAELFDGAASFVPPGMEQAKGQILLAKNMLPLAIGVTWDDLSAALSGHVVVTTSVPPAGAAPQPADALVMVGVGDQAKADSVLNALLDKLATQSGMKKEPAEVQGHKGFRVSAEATAVTIVRVDDVIMAAVAPERIEQALKLQESLKGTAPGDVLDGDAVFGFAVDVDALTKSLQQQGATSGDLSELWKPYAKDGYLNGRAVVDGKGLLFGGGQGGGAVVAFMAGVGAAVAIPAFVRYVKHAKTTEASVNVQRMYQGAVAYYTEHQAFPPSAPLTPATPFCPSGQEKFPPNPADWQQPGWQALGFTIDEAHYYKYEFVANGSGPGAGFTARAVGDLDCDGVFSTFERAGTVNDQGGVEGGMLERIDEME